MTFYGKRAIFPLKLLGRARRASPDTVVKAATTDRTHTKMAPRKKKLDLLQGTLDLLILQALVGRTRHGYEIARWIEATTKSALTVEEGSLYPALHRMVQRGWITATWGLSENNRRAKFYTLTRDGTSQLGIERRKWSRFAEAMTLIVESPPGEAVS